MFLHASVQGILPATTMLKNLMFWKSRARKPSAEAAAASQPKPSPAETRSRLLVLAIKNGQAKAWR